MCFFGNLNRVAAICGNNPLGIFGTFFYFLDSLLSLEDLKNANIIHLAICICLYENFIIVL